MSDDDQQHKKSLAWDELCKAHYSITCLRNVGAEHITPRTSAELLKASEAMVAAAQRIDAIIRAERLAEPVTVILPRALGPKQKETADG